MKLLFAILFQCLFFFSFSQQTAYFDVKHAEVSVAIQPELKEISGSVVYRFEVLKDTNMFAIDAKNMTIKNVFLDEKTIDFEYDNEQIKLNKNFNKSDLSSLKIEYYAKPKKALYFITSESKAANQVWTQGQGKYTSNWLPSFDDMNEKIEFDITIEAPSAYEVVANGKLLEKETLKASTRWKYDMHSPMSSYLVALTIGKYDVIHKTSNSGIPLELYYYPSAKNYVEPTYRYSDQIFDFLEEEIGVPFPWQNYKQVPVKDFLYAGMENTSLTIFSDSFLIDSIGFTDKNYINVNAHELAHQWFGDLVTEENSEHHWLQEGFATYYALLAEKEVFGEDYFYTALYKTAKQLEALNEQGGESLLNPKASSLTFYQRGAWAVFALRNLIGDRAFQKSVKKYLTEYAYKNANTHDFINIASAKSQLKLNDFVEKWFVSKDFPIADAKLLLQQNKISKTLLELDEMSKEEVISFAESNPEIYTSEAQLVVVETILQRLLPNSEAEKAIFSKALHSEILKTRQAVALYMNPIPVELKADFEKLLTDKSYLTIEKALMKLWVNFPFTNDRKRYLDATKNVVGFRDRNVETLWLTLALITEGYQETNKKQYYDTLVAYTNPTEHFEVRQYAFQYLYQIQGWNEKSLANLVNACRHPVWQFSKFSKELLTELISDKEYKIMLESIADNLPTEEQMFLKQQLKK
ncbi:M1 family metallopeptidase [Joostella sp. CR20]|uniref:M1 family metallopeptidase n=1 Tax=Joostella sp. CR20 TaxID=2804312 RepID=UPI00313E53CB